MIDMNRNGPIQLEYPVILLWGEIYIRMVTVRMVNMGH